MSRLSSKERARLRSQAHPLKPILQVGADGISPAFGRSLTEAFNTRELLKVKVLDTSDLSAREAADAVGGEVDGVEVVQVIGRTLVLYRPFPEEAGEEGVAGRR